MYIISHPANMSSSGKDGFPLNPYPEWSFESGIEVDRREELIRKARLKEAKRRIHDILQILREETGWLTEKNEKALDAIRKAVAEKEVVEKK